MKKLATLTPKYTKRFGNSDETKSMQVLYKNEYLRHSSPLVSCGDVLLCAPTVYLPENEKQNSSSIGSGGCMFVLTNKPDAALIRRLSLFTHKIIATIWAYQDLVRIAVEKSRVAGAEDAFKMMQHALGNTRETLRIVAPEGEPYYALDEVMLDACVAYGNQVASNALRWPKIRSSFSQNEKMFPVQALQSTFFSRESKLTLDASGVEGRLIDPRFAALIIELSRNLHKHSRGVFGQIRIQQLSKGMISVFANGEASVAEAYKLRSRLMESINHDKRSLRGIPTIKLVAGALGNPKAEIDCSFMRNSVSDVMLEQELHEPGLVIRVRGPHFVFENVESPDDKLTFELKVSCLNAILSKL